MTNCTLEAIAILADLQANHDGPDIDELLTHTPDIDWVFLLSLISTEEDRQISTQENHQ